VKIAILTSFAGFSPGYSLTGIVADQAEMLIRHGHDVGVLVCENYTGPETIGGARVTKAMPAADLVDYATIGGLSQAHRETVKRVRDELVQRLRHDQVVLTHDMVFTGWSLPYGLGCVEASKTLDCGWLHWVHSIPSTMRDWWNIRSWGPMHRIVYPNAADRTRVAEQYRGGIDDVRVIPHIKDPRTWMEFSEETRALIDQVPGILSSDVVQLLPASADRMEAKRVRDVIDLFARFKRRGRSVCLVVANQWATTKTRREDASRYMEFAEAAGLVPGKEVVFTSEFGYGTGISRRMVRELFACSNLFIFPTREESFGLVVPEAAMSGCLCVLNRSLPMQVEITGSAALYFDFGSYCNRFAPPDPDGYMNEVAMIILARMGQSEAIMTKTLCRQQYNMDSVYNRYYAPALVEAAHWRHLR